jgi:hypothetical protein
LKQVLTGYFAYYAVRTNGRTLAAFRQSRTSTVPILRLPFAPAGAPAAGEGVEEFDRGPVKGAESLFLNPVGHHSPQQVCGVLPAA